MSGGDELQGIDVSHWQKKTPILTGLGFLIARATYGTDPDSTFVMHTTAARKAGLVTGAYHYGRHGNVSGQVDAFLQAAETADVDLIAVDLEKDGDNPAMTNAEAKAFIDAVRARGRKIGLYASSLRPYPDLGQDWRWVADYRDISHPPVAWDIWQYTSSDGKLDRDRFRGTKDELRLLGRDDMKPAPITDERPGVTIDAAAGADWYDVDNVTKLGDGVDAPMTGRPSPYGVGTFGSGGRRAIYVTLSGLRRTVLITPTAVHEPQAVARTVVLDEAIAAIQKLR